MFSWRLIEHIYANASPKTIWAIWTDVNHWPEWNQALEWIELQGDFHPGVQGRLKQKGWPTNTFVLTKVDREVSFHHVTEMPLATTILFSHNIHKQEQGAMISYQVVAKGPLAPLLRLTLRKKLKKSIPLALKALASLAARQFAP